MSLYFNLNLNIELSYRTPKEIIGLFSKKMNQKTWNQSDKAIIPFDNEIEYLFELDTYQTHQCLQTFHFQKQTYLRHPEFQKYEDDFHCFNLCRTIKDDGFYQGGYELIVWLAQYSRTNGYIGEFHESGSTEVKVMFTEFGIVTVRNVRLESMFQMSPEDFKLEPPNTLQLRRIHDLQSAIDSQNWRYAKIKIDELRTEEPNNRNYRSIADYVTSKIDTTDNRVR